LAVSSANRHGRPAATTVLEAATALGDAVEVYLDAGTSRGGVASTILDATGPVLRVVRAGALTLSDLIAVVPEIEDPENTAAEVAAATAGATPQADSTARADTAEQADAEQAGAAQTVGAGQAPDGAAAVPEAEDGADRP